MPSAPRSHWEPFNERGDEVGGLTYQGQRTDGGYRASGGIMFDQF